MRACMCVCVCVCMYVCMYVCIYIYTSERERQDYCHVVFKKIYISKLCFIYGFEALPFNFYVELFVIMRACDKGMKIVQKRVVHFFFFFFYRSNSSPF